MSEAVEAATDYIVDTTFGPIQGRIKDDVVLFSGVPYAAAPVGDLRFKAPQPHRGWEEVRPATRFSPAAPQLPGEGMSAAMAAKWDEDCLYLNVCTPAADGRKRPVFFWIHGGAYRTGQGAMPWYNGAQFAKHGDIVVVSINYRMGALGFTNLQRFGDEFETSGANGTLDQITALNWVIDNIANFGGDPEQITVAGESAGAFSVATLLASPRSEGRFKRAIPQSGAGQHTIPAEITEKVADCVFEKAGISTLEELMALPVDDILKVQAEVEIAAARGEIPTLGINLPFYPSEGNSVNPGSPLDAIKAGASANVDILIGTNKDESTMFVTGSFDEDKLRRAITRYGADESLIEVYKQRFPNVTATELAIQIQTDHTFRIPAIRLAEARLEQPGKTFMYLFAWESRVPNLKSTHALEIPFVFDNLNAAGVKAFIGRGDIPQDLADKMHQTWIDFICRGEPGWDEYDEQRRLNMRFDTDSVLVEDPDDQKRQAWQGIR
tara:strand:+ start:13994 stop:15478 length:1485 start_codon:yes stop_codon:yes gene_type:complete